LDSEKEAAKRLSQYFTTVYTTDPPAMSAASNNSDDPIHRYFRDGTATCSDINLDIDVIISAISRLRPDKAVGPDGLGLSPKLLLEVCNEIVYPYPLLLLFRKSFNKSFVPHNWRQANITPAITLQEDVVQCG